MACGASPHAGGSYLGWASSSNTAARVGALEAAAAERQVIRDSAPQRTKLGNLVLLQVKVTWVRLRQANTPPGLAARRVKARQSYMGGSNLVSPSPC